MSVRTRSLIAFGLSAFAASTPAHVFAQPAAPSPDQVTSARAQSQLTPRTAAAATPLSVTTTSREEVRDFYRAIYAASENIPLAWTGNYSASSAVAAAGETSTALKEAVLLRINFFRALAGVPAGVTLNTTFAAKDQQAALMMSANRALSHTPPPSWIYYTAAGAEAAGQSNLSLGLFGPAAISSLMQDSDGSGSLVVVGANAIVGHRRWFLYPPTREMGTGDVPGNGANFLAAHASWVTANFGAPRPATRDNFVAFPAPGYVPHQLVFARWSFSYPSADFSAATVTMTRAGAPISVRRETPANGSGENTLVWVYDSANINTIESDGHARPPADLTYSVSITGVKVGATTLPPFNYNVIVFDPDVPTPGATPVAVSGPASPGIGSANAYTVAKPTYASGFEWRTLALRNFSKTYNAETGLDGLITVSSAGGPPVVQSNFVGAGTAAYRLSESGSFSTQLLTLPDTFLVSSGASLSLLSRLGIVTASQAARVQVSNNDGATWQDISTQIGSSRPNADSPTPTDAAFTTRTIPLTAYAGRTIRVRLALTVDSNASIYLPDATNLVGWFIDNLTLTGVQIATVAAPVSVSSGAAFSFSPTVVGPVGLQARGVLSGAYPLEWGPVTSVSAIVAGNPANPARLINLSILTDLPSAGENFTLGYVVGGAGTSGTKPLVIRAAGPSLAAFGLPDLLADPKVELFTSTGKTTENDNWGGSTDLTAALAAVGAFAFSSPGSKDSALVANILTRDNSVQVSSANNGTGRVLAEVYDATPSSQYTTTTPRLLNVSVRKHLGTGVTMGFTVGGTGSKTILIRAVGPGLAAFGVPGTVIDPQLTLFNDKSEKVGENNDWAGTPALTTAFTAVGAFSLPAATSKDAALLTTLSPGGYTVQVSGVANTTGVALVEVYEVP